MLLDRPVDLDCVDVPGAVPQRDRDIRSGAGPNDQDVVVRPSGKPLVELVVELLLRRRLGEALVGMPLTFTYISPLLTM